MRLRSVAVESFGCIRKARVELKPGLNVLYGPNDLGKSTLISAVRAALLLPHTSSAHSDFVPWHTGDAPQVEVVFETEPERIYKVTKRYGAGAKSTLELSRDGLSYSHEASARAVDGTIRGLLKWGLPDAAGRTQGMADSFLVKTLLAPQPEVTEILASTLEHDKEESGRKRVLEALETIAEDPTFKQVLKAAQRKVSEAFTATGRRQQGRSHFWTRIKNDLNDAAARVRELEAEKQKSDTVRAELEQLQLQLEQLRAQYDDAKREHESLAQRRAQQTELEKATQRVTAAKTRLDELAELQTSLETAKADAEAAASAVDAAKAALKAAQKDADAATATREQATEQLRRAEGEGGAQQRELELERLKGRRQELTAKLDAAQATQQAAGRALERTEKLREVEKKVSTLKTTITALKEEQQAAEAARDEARDNVEGHQDLLEYLNLKELRAAQSMLDTLRESVQQLQAALKGKTIPAEEELSQLQQLHRDLELAEAKLELGLAVSVDPEKPPLKVSVAMDGKRAKTQNVSLISTFEAKQALKLKLPGVATLEVTAGSETQRKALEQLRKRWEKESQAAFTAAGAKSFDELQILARKQDNLHTQQDRLAQVESTLASQRSLSDEVSRLEKHLEEYAPEDLESSIEEFDDKAEIQTTVNACAAELSESQAALDAATQKLEDTELQLKLLAPQLESAQEAAEEATADLDGDPAQLLTAAQKSATDLQSQLNQLQEQEATLSQGQDQQLIAAKAAVEKAKVAEASAKRATEQAQQQLGEAQAAHVRATTLIETHVGALAAAKPAVAQEEHDNATAAEAVQRDALAALVGCHPDDLQLLPPDAEDQARAAVDQATQALQAKRQEIDRLQGSLTQVGGDVIADELSEAHAAVKRLRDEQHARILDYDAWQLLQQTLEEAERAEGTNLGAVLAKPVSARFSELTQGRYPQLKLSAHLETEGVNAAGDERDVTRLSAGTQEQLSTIFRLCLAERLQSAVILDDHLSQTDSQRMSWFRTTLEEVAQKAQVVIVTCWPEHYQLGDAHRVDLSAEIERY